MKKLTLILVSSFLVLFGVVFVLAPPPQELFLFDQNFEANSTIIYDSEQIVVSAFYYSFGDDVGPTLYTLNLQTGAGPTLDDIDTDCNDDDGDVERFKCISVDCPPEESSVSCGGTCSAMTITVESGDYVTAYWVLESCPDASEGTNATLMTDAVSSQKDELDDEIDIQINAPVGGDCWTKTGSILFIPKDCIYYKSSGDMEDLI